MAGWSKNGKGGKTRRADVPKRGSGPSVGTDLLVAILNRCLAPRSKARVAEWFDQTVLRRLVDVEARQLTSQRFWDNMDRVSETTIAAIEADLARRVVEDFDVDLSRVLFDATNFFTFIDHGESERDGTYRAPQVHAELAEQGPRASLNRVARVMREAEIRA